MLWLFFVPPKPEKTRHLGPPDVAAFWFLPKGAEIRKAIPLFDLANLCIPPPIQARTRLLEAAVPLRPKSQRIADPLRLNQLL